MSLTLDAADCANKDDFLAMTGHIITADFKLEEILLDFVYVDKTHTGEHFAELVKETMGKYGITKEDV
jgi:hypothetical protein